MLENGALERSVDGTMASISVTGQASTQHFSVGDSLEKFLAIQFSGFFEEELAFACKTRPEAIAETVL